MKVRDITIPKIKKEMLSLMSDGKTRYIDEIARELKLDAIDVAIAFDQLNNENRLFSNNGEI